ncbi:MAG: Uma2 family endonuclease [Chloroflexota bacterium]
MVTCTEAPVILESGDCMTREEFHRRYLARPDIKKAELVEGVVFVGGRVRASHGEANAFIAAWLGSFAMHAPDVHVGLHATVILDERNEVQPDVLAWRPAPGDAHLTEDGFLHGPLSLVVEVAASSVSYDLHQKKEAYRRNGVREYVVWRVLDRAIDWFRLQDGEYVLIPPDGDGVVESEQFPGLRLHVQSLLAGDMAAVIARLGSGA